MSCLLKSAKKSNDDGKFLRIHKRIIEVNNERKAKKEKPILSPYDDDIVDLLNKVKISIDKKVYDRNDILKKDAYFGQTVMSEITTKIYELNIKENPKDIDFIKNRISKQYLDEYNMIYNAA